jgi:hypothetical protein
MIARTTCQQCGVHIEFEAENANEFVACPSCSKQTRLLIRDEPTLQGTSRAMGGEECFFESGNILVTNARFVVGAKTFAVRGITSVHGIQDNPSNIAPILLISLGFLLALNLFTEGLFVGIVGVLILGAGIWLFKSRKPMFNVVLKTADGETTAYRDYSKTLVASVINALNKAIIANG